MTTSRETTTTTTTTIDNEFLLFLKKFQDRIKHIIKKRIAPQINDFINWVNFIAEMSEEQKNNEQNFDWQEGNKILIDCLIIAEIDKYILENFQNHINSVISDPHSADKIRNLITWFEYLQKYFNFKRYEFILNDEKLKNDEKEELKEELIKEYNEFEKMTLDLKTWKKRNSGKFVTPGPLALDYKDIYYSLIYDCWPDSVAKESLKEEKKSIRNELINKILTNQRLRIDKKFPTEEISSYITNSLKKYDKNFEAWKAKMEEEGKIEKDDLMIFFWKEDKAHFEKELLNILKNHNYTCTSKELSKDLENYKEKKVDNVFHSRVITSERLKEILDSQLEESDKINILKTEYAVLNKSSPNSLLTIAIGDYLNLNDKQNQSPSQSERQQPPHIIHAQKLLGYIDEFERSFSYKFAKFFNLNEVKEYDNKLKELGELAHQLISSPYLDNISEIDKMKFEDLKNPNFVKILGKIKDKIAKGKEINVLKNTIITPILKNENFSNPAILQFLIQNKLTNVSTQVEISLKTANEWSYKFNQTNLTNPKFFTSNENKRELLKNISSKLSNSESSVKPVKNKFHN